MSCPWLSNNDFETHESETQNFVGESWIFQDRAVFASGDEALKQAPHALTLNQHMFIAPPCNVLVFMQELCLSSISLQMFSWEFKESPHSYSAIDMTLI